ncbi:hypothetical protein Peur_019517 [Populus x canadensis]
MNTQIQIFFRRNEAYVAIESCLGSKSTDHAAHLHGAPGKKSQSLVFGIDENEFLVHVFDVELVELQEQLVEPCSFYHPTTLIPLQLIQRRRGSSVSWSHPGKGKSIMHRLVKNYLLLYGLCNRA